MTTKGIVSFIIGCIGITVCVFLKTGETKETIWKIALGAVIAGVTEFIIFLFENRKRWKLLKTKFYKRNKPVRLTLAYLFRIEVNGQYVLIERHKKDRIGFQPVGGAYKYFKEETRDLFDKLGIEPCNYVPRDDDTEHDLRIIIRKRKNLIEFLKWFESRKNREIDPNREFYEELIEPNLLPADKFKQLKYVFIGKHEEGILASSVFPIDEYRYADIFELRLDTDEQRKAIQDLKQKEKILFVTPEEIRKIQLIKGKIFYLTHLKYYRNDESDKQTNKDGYPA